MKTSRPSFSCSMYSVPVIGVAPMILPVVSGLAAKACWSARTSMAFPPYLFDKRTPVRSPNRRIRKGGGRGKRGANSQPPHGEVLAAHGAERGFSCGHGGEPRTTHGPARAFHTGGAHLFEFCVN